MIRRGKAGLVEPLLSVGQKITTNKELLTLSRGMVKKGFVDDKDEDDE
jgi:hypothetical protein